MKKVFQLTIVSQEKLLVQLEVEQVMLTTSTGVITVLPDHAPLFSQVVECQLEYVSNGQTNTLVVSRGFIDISGQNKVVVMVDTGKHEREISVEKSQLAIESAHKTMETSQNVHELRMAEAALKQALLELRIAERSKKRSY